MSDFENYESVNDRKPELDSFNERLIDIQIAIMEYGDDLSMQIAGEFVDELDDFCPYMGERVYLRGKGTVPIFDQDGDYETEGPSDLNKLYEGIHGGFAILKDTNE